MWTRLTVLVTPHGGGKAVARAGHTLSILRKENGKWLLSRDANLLSPVPPPHDDAQQRASVDAAKQRG